MPILTEASLSPKERKVVDAIVARLADALGDQLQSIWLYGSRARGEPPHPESDVDLLVVLDTSSREDERRVLDAVDRAAEDHGISAFLFSTLVYDAARVAQRRAIESFFIQEVDRDKIVLHGIP